jgi:hypothetical protein
VVVRDPEGLQPYDFFITTDTRADPAVLTAHYAGRWSIEVTFRDEKQHSGGEDPQCWKRLGPERAACLSLWLHAAIWLWYLQVWAPPRSPTHSPHSGPAYGPNELHRCAPPGGSRQKSVTN